MDWKELFIVFTFLVLSAFTFRPGIKNFKVVLNDTSNSRATPAVRKFVLFWLGLGVVCTIFIFFFSIYTLIIRSWPSFG